MKLGEEHEASAVCDFVCQFLEDRARNIERPLSAYLTHFPEHEGAVAREYLLLTASAADTEERPAKPDGADRFGPYSIEAELGRGGQSVVYRAVDTRLGRTVALKVLTGLTSLTREAQRRFTREARVTSRLQHPGVCTLYDVGLHEDTPYIAMQYVEGRPLSSLLAESSKDTARAAETHRPSVRTREWVERTVTLFARIARTLHAAHQAGIVHRDLKPGNIIVTHSGQPVLLDFGLALDRSDGEVLTRTGDRFGTPAYMSPEQLRGGTRRAGPASDVFSLGVTLYEALTLERPFGGSTPERLTLSITKDTPSSARRLNPALGRDLDVILETALQKQPRHRYASAEAMAEDLERARDGRPIGARPTPAAVRLVRWVRREPLRAGLLLSLVVVAALGGVLASRWRDAMRGREARLAIRIEGDLEEAFTLLESSPDAALPLFRGVRARDPGSTEAIAGEALALIDLGRPQEALAMLRSVAPPLEREPGLELVRANALVHLDRRAEAAGILDRSLPPRTSLAFFLAGVTALHRHRDDAGEALAKAAGLLRKAILHAPRERFLHAAMYARAARRLKDRATIEEAADLLLNRWPDRRRARRFAAQALAEVEPERALAMQRELFQGGRDLTGAIHYSNALAREGRFEEVLSTLDAALRHHPDSVELRLERCVALTSLGRYREALETADGLVAEHPELSGPWATRALALAGLGRDREARSAAGKAVDLDPDDPLAVSLMAMILAERGLAEEATTLLERLRDRRFADMQVQRNLAYALLRLERPRDALQHIERAVRRNPRLGSNHALLAQVQLELGQPAEAEASFRKAMACGFESAASYLGLGNALRLLGRKEEALSAWTRAVEIAPRYLPAHLNRGINLFHHGRLDEAEQTFRRVLELRPGLPAGEFFLGWCLLRRGLAGEALPHLRRGHELGSRRPAWPYPSGRVLRRAERLSR